MADDQTPDEAAQLREALAARDRELAAATARAQSMEESFNAFGRQQQATAQQQASVAPGKRYAMPPNVRQQILAGGVTEAELDQNGDLIIPFINAYLGQAAQEVLAIMQQQADQIQQLHMLRDAETYPHADRLFNEMSRIRETELKQGRYINPETAYRLAVANNYERLAGEGSPEGGQFEGRREAPPPTPMATRSRDLSAVSSLRTMRAPVTTPERAPTTSSDLMSMTREERRAFFEANGETPIRSSQG